MRVQRKPIAEINVVPYIDVMLVLVMIFMITAPLLSQGVNVELPKSTAKPMAQQKEPIVLSINANGQYFLNIAANPEQVIDANFLLNTVSDALRKAKEQGELQSVFVKGDKHVDYDKVVQAMVLLQKAGAESVGLMTQDP